MNINLLIYERTDVYISLLKYDYISTSIYAYLFYSKFPSFTLNFHTG